MSDVDATTAAEARWRNYQHLIWTQQQIQLQIQQQNQQNRPHSHHQQQMQNVKVEMEQQGGTMSNHSGNASGATQQQQQSPQQQSVPMPPEENGSEEKAGKGEGMDAWDNFDAQAAFLGPTLWDKRLPYDGQDFKLEYVDLEEFLTENGIPVDQQQQHHQQHNGHPPSNNNNGSVNSSSGGSSNNSSSNGMTAGDQVSADECSPSPRANGGHLAQQLPPQQQPHHVGQYGPGPSARNNQGHNNHNDHIIHHNNLSNSQNLLRGPPSIHTQSESASRSPSPCGSSISSHSDDSNCSISPEHHHEGNLRKIVSNGITVSMSEFALASFPGHNFDPRTRIFTEDELKPQPMIKKSKKQFVPDNAKDAKYWARRRKNNMAAKRSRDARRVKENQIAMRACFLEKENSILKSEIDRIQKENMMLKEQLNCCRRDH